jgi:ABC-2 type transport system ATP-binding protein
VSAVKVRGLRKVYGRNRVVALNSLELEVEEKTIFGYLGPNGAGKTTTIKILTGLMRPTAGQAWVAGETVSFRSTGFRANIGYLSQKPTYYAWMTARELLGFVGELFGLSPKENRRRVSELLALSGLVEHADRRVGEYSGGMVQRLGIAQALVNQPAVLFLDEPCASLDPMGRREVLEMIGRLKDRSTVFMSTHILADAERVCDVVGILDRGELVTVEKTASLKQRFAVPVLRLDFDKIPDARRFAEMAGGHSGKIGEISVSEGAVSLKSSDLPKTRAESLKIIAAHDLSLERMEVESSTLEDIFVRIVKG